MKLKVLGCSGAEFRWYNLTAFLLDGRTLLDAGTVGSRLTGQEQWNIKNILLTHSHLDHVKGIPFLADNIIITNKQHSITVYGIKETLASLRENLLNDRVWPDFTKISAAIDPVVKLNSITVGRSFEVDGYTVKAHRVNHTVPAVGFEIRDKKGRTLLYTGDTGPAHKIWTESVRPNALIIEVSFPNDMEAMALKTGHLTARLLLGELGKMKKMPDRILITHLKPQYRRQIRDEIKGIGIAKIEMLKEGVVYEI